MAIQVLKRPLQARAGGCRRRVQRDTSTYVRPRDTRLMATLAKRERESPFNSSKL